MKYRSEKNKADSQAEVLLGKFLFKSRGQRSEISGEFLGDEYNHSFCSHLLAKGAYPSTRLVSRNIVLMTPQEHRAWEFERHTLLSRPEWQWVFRLFEVLRLEYYHGKYSRYFFAQKLFSR